MITINRTYRPTHSRVGVPTAPNPVERIHINPRYVVSVEDAEMYDHHADGEGFVRTVGHITLITGQRFDTTETANEIIDRMRNQ